MKFVLLSLAIWIAVALVACSAGPTDEEIRAIVRAEVQAAIAEVKQGPPGEQGPLPSDEHLSTLISEVVTARLSELSGPQGLRGEQGPQGELGPFPSDAQLSTLINGVITVRLNELRGPQGLQGEQGPQGARGPQGIPGTAELSAQDRVLLNKVGDLEYALYGSQGVPSRFFGSNDIRGLRSDLDKLRSEVKCELGGSPWCSSSLHGIGSNVGSRITSLEADVKELERVAHSHPRY